MLHTNFPCLDLDHAHLKITTSLAHQIQTYSVILQERCFVQNLILTHTHTSTMFKHIKKNYTCIIINILASLHKLTTCQSILNLRRQQGGQVHGVTDTCISTMKEIISSGNCMTSLLNLNLNFRMLQLFSDRLGNLWTISINPLGKTDWPHP